MIALKGAPPVRRSRSNPGLDRDTFVRPIAHRGLHDATAGRLENTAPAFQAAIDRGYGIECDLQPADDGTPMVFHDDKLDRLVAATGRIAAYSPTMLSRFRYKGLDQKILTFAQFLDLVGGRVPLLVEVKGKKSGTDAAFLEKIARQARAYDGPIALMSFNRAIVAALGERAPTIPRGAIVGGQQVSRELVGRKGRDARKRRGLPRVRIGTRQRRLLRRRRETGGGGAKMDVPPRTRFAAVHLDRENAQAARGGRALGRRTDLRRL